MSTSLAPQPSTQRPVSESERLIEQQLRRTGAQVKGLDLTASLLVLGVLLVSAAFVLAVVDSWLVPGGLSRAGRFVGLLSLLALGGAYFVRYVCPPLLRRVSPAYAAYTIEQARPSLKNSLLNLVLLRQENAPVPQRILQAVEVQAARGIVDAQAETFVDRARLIRLLWVVAAVASLLAVYTVGSPKNPFQSIARLLAPWASIDAPARVEFLEILPGSTALFHDQNAEIRVKLRGLREGESVTVVYSTADGRVESQNVALTWSQSVGGYTGLLPVVGGGIQEDLRYHVVAGDAISAEFQLDALRAPAIAVTAVEYVYPAYTGLPPRTAAAQPDVQAIEGTRVTIRALANEEIGSAAIDLNCDGTRDVVMQSSGKEAFGSFTLALDSSRRLPAWPNYQLRFTNQEGQENPSPSRHAIAVTADLPPEVAFREPVADPAVPQEIPLGTILRFVVQSRDPDFQLAGLRWQSERGGKPLQTEDLLAAPRSGDVQGFLMFDTQAAGLKDGDEVIYWATAVDNKDPLPNETQTARYTLRIVGQLNEQERQEQLDQAQQQPPPDGGQQQPDGQPRQPGDQPQGEQPPDEQPMDGAGEGQPQQGRPPQQRPEEGGEQSPDGQSGEQQPADGQAGEPGQQSSDAQPGQAGQQPQPGQQGEGDPQSQPGEQSAEPRQGEEPNPGESPDSSDGPRGQQQPRPPGGQAGQQDQSSAGAQRPPRRDKPLDPQAQAGDAFDEIFDRLQERGDTQDEQPPQPSPEQVASADQPGAEQQPEPERQPAEQQPAEQPMPGQEPRAEQQPAGEQPAGEQPPMGEQPAGEQPTGEESATPQPMDGAGGEGSEQGEQSPEVQPTPDGQAGAEGSQASEQAGEPMPAGQSGQPQAGQQPSGDNPQPMPGEGGEPMPGGQSEQGGMPPEASGEPMPGEAGAAGQPMSEQPPREGAEAGEPMSGHGDQASPTEPGGREQQPAGQQGAVAGGDGQSENGEAGAGRPREDQQGSAESAQPSRPREKPSPEQGGMDDATAEEGGNSSVSQRESDSQGQSSGSQSGGGQEGAGQQADQQGTGGAGSNTEADEGGSAGQQQGEGQAGQEGGEQMPAEGQTGGESSQQQGSGSRTRPGDSQQGEGPAPQGGQPQPGQREPGERQPGQPQPGQPQGEPQPGEQGADQAPEPGQPREGDSGQDSQGESQVSEGSPSASNPRDGQGASGGGQPGDSQGEVQSGDQEPAQPQESQEPGGDEANLDYARQVTDLALRKLRDQLDRGEVDQELLDRLGWSEDDLRQFVEHWEQLKRDAREDSPAGDAARAELDEQLRALGLRPQSSQVSGGGVSEDDARQMRAGRRSPPPAEYQDQYEAYSTGTAQDAQ